MGGKHTADSFVVRCPTGMKDKLSSAAASQGLTRNALVLKSLERTLGIAHVDGELPAESHVCPHPAAKEEKVMSGKSLMMIRCGVCKVRLR